MSTYIGENPESSERLLNVLMKSLKCFTKNETQFNLEFTQLLLSYKQIINIKKVIHQMVKLHDTMYKCDTVNCAKQKYIISSCYQVVFEAIWR